MTKEELLTLINEFNSLKDREFEIAEIINNLFISNIGFNGLEIKDISTRKDGYITLLFGEFGKNDKVLCLFPEELITPNIYKERTAKEENDKKVTWEKKELEAAEKKDREEYERLKKKYENA